LPNYANVLKFQERGIAALNLKFAYPFIAPDGVLIQPEAIRYGVTLNDQRTERLERRKCFKNFIKFLFKSVSLFVSQRTSRCGRLADVGKERLILAQSLVKS